MVGLLGGMVTMGFVIAASFFFRFWQKTADSLFGWFSVAFVLLACNQALIVISPLQTESASLLYLPRLLAFGLIIVAIVRKNLRGVSQQ